MCGFDGHLCFDCKYNQQIDDKDEPSFYCLKNIVEDWSIGAYRIVHQCDGYEFDEMEFVNIDDTARLN